QRGARRSTVSAGGGVRPDDRGDVEIRRLGHRRRIALASVADEWRCNPGAAVGFQPKVEVLEEISDREHRRRVLVVQESALANSESGRKANQDREDLLPLETESLTGRQQLRGSGAGDAEHAVGD